MKSISSRLLALACCLGVHLTAIPLLRAGESAPRAFIDGNGLGWQTLDETFFTHVNCDPGTWTWSNGFVHCTGKPIGVIRSTKIVTNFEVVAQWRHLQSGGNSGIFLWATPESIKALEAGKGRLP